ncbi:hypothetical protein ACI4BE_29465, partial [Klebsiella pneumoniae]|uniref:hypothetical protein n=1 Tax=Klebsiella pneumoniae TaxID=573 RepID=UPI0038531475
MVDEAWRAVADALRRGRAHEARTFLRLVHELREEVRRDERLAQIAAAKAAADTTDPELHHLHSESKGAASEPTDPNAEPVA